METAMKLRRLILIEGRSIRSVSRETGISRNTLRKYLRSESPPTFTRLQPVVLHKLRLDEYKVSASFSAYYRYGANDLL